MKFHPSPPWRRAVLLMAVLAVGGCASQAGAASADGCPGLPTGAADATALAGALQVDGYGVGGLLTEAVAADLSPLVAFLETHAGLDHTSVCLTVDNTTGEVAVGRGEVSGTAYGEHRAVVLTIRPNALLPLDDQAAGVADRVSSMARRGLIHVALWQASGGWLPGDLPANSVAWYAARIAGYPAWRSEQMPDPLRLEPSAAGLLTGSFSAFAVARTGMQIIAHAAPDTPASFTPGWGESTPTAWNPGTAGFAISLGALVVASASLLVALRRRRQTGVVPAPSVEGAAADPPASPPVLAPAAGPTSAFAVAPPVGSTRASQRSPEYGKPSAAATLPNLLRGGGTRPGTQCAWTVACSMAIQSRPRPSSGITHE